MKTKIKICGLFRECDIAWANEMKPDYIGFVLVNRGHRYITDEQAAHLRSLLDPGITPVGVFINREPQQVADLLAQGVIDMAQLHGFEDEDYIYTLKKLTNKPLIKAFRVENEDDIRKAQLSPADYILLDHGAGGTGESFDWSLLKNMQREYFLAGGLTPDNVQEALAQAHPFALDVSSGVETDKKKDREKMKRFMENVKHM